MITPERAMQQATDSADYYMQRAIVEINNRFGTGYAEKNPDLVGVFMTIASNDNALAYSIGVVDVPE